MDLRSAPRAPDPGPPAIDGRPAVSLYLFAQDILDEGVEAVLDRLQEAGANSITLAVSYHHGRDVHPHNPKHRVVFHEGGTVYFRPDIRLYDLTPLKPTVARIALEADPLARLVDAAVGRSMAVSAWTVFLHNSRLGLLHPESTAVNAFGDRLVHSLCPANPGVVSYATALATDVARYGVRSIAIEALSYLPFDHGYHHERNFLRLSPTVRYLMGLCFCRHCLAAAADLGVDGEHVRAEVARLIDGVCQSSAEDRWGDDIDLEVIRPLAGGQLGGFLQAREAVVTHLAYDVTEAVHGRSPQVRTVFLDLSGGVLGYADGRPKTDAVSPSIAWRDGVAVRDVAEVCDGLGVLAYFADLDRLLREVTPYRDIVPPNRRLEVLLRPMIPDVTSPAELAAKVEAVRALGDVDLSFYHYGFMRLESLDWIRAALARGEQSGSPLG
jgi:hypothetical protein